MRRIALILGLLALGCGGGDDTTADANAARGGDGTTAAANATADADAQGMPIGIALADVAGTWDITATLLTEEPTTITYSVVATDSETSWILNLNTPTREHIIIQIVSVDGDSIVGVAGPFESILMDDATDPREGEMVTIRTVSRLQGEMLVGTLTATYDTDPVQTVSGTFEGTRVVE